MVAVQSGCTDDRAAVITLAVLVAVYSVVLGILIAVLSSCTSYIKTLKARLRKEKESSQKLDAIQD